MVTEAADDRAYENGPGRKKASFILCVRLAAALTVRDERMRASAPVARDVRRSVHALKTGSYRGGVPIAVEMHATSSGILKAVERGAAQAAKSARRLTSSLPV